MVGFDALIDQSPQRGEIRLIVSSGKHRGKAVLLPLKIFVIGRNQECHLRLTSRLVSSRHCALAPHARGLIVYDLKSSNGSYVNGRRISRQERLRHGDELQVGPIRFRLFVPEVLTWNGPLDRYRREIAWLWNSADNQDRRDLEDAGETLTGTDAALVSENGDHSGIVAGRLWTRTSGNGKA